MLKIALGAVLLASSLAAAPALAFVPAVGHAVCPIDGKPFDYPSFAAYSTYGARLDGKPFGSASFPLALAECPGSKFPVYREFKPEEIAKVKAVAASAEFRALADETPYFRLHGVVAAMGETQDARTYTALEATWQAEGQPERYRRYAAVYFQEADALVAQSKPTDQAYWNAQFYAADVARQSGDFAGAAARLAKLNDPAAPAGMAAVIKQEAGLIEARNTKPAMPPSRFADKAAP